jgi:oxygen-dependent protoporphyrinogen oxidase
MRVAVVGGGAAGLAAALDLADGGVDVVLFEASARAGGKLASHREQGFLTEDGPNALAGSDPAPRNLATPGMLDGQEVFAPRDATRFVWRRGRLVRASPRNLFHLSSPGGLARAVLEPLLARRTAGEESLQSLCRRHFGSEVGDLVARLMARGVYASEPDRLSASDAFPSLASLGRRHRSLLLGAFIERLGRHQPAPGLWSLREGLGALAGAAAARLGARLRLEASVAQLGPSGSGWDLAFQGRATGSEHFDGVVLALPAAAGARLAKTFSGPLAGMLGPFSATPVAVVHLGVRSSDLETAAEGFGLLNGDGALGMLGVLFPAALFPERAPAGHSLLTVLLGGTAHPELVSLPEVALVDLARAELRRVMGLEGLPVYTRVIRHAEAIPRYEIGHAARVAAARAACQGLPPLVLAGAAFHGVSVGRAVSGGRDAARALRARVEAAG